MCGVSSYQWKHVFLFFFVSINRVDFFFHLLKKCSFFSLDSGAHLRDDHVLSGRQGRHLLCIDTVPNLSTPPPKDTGEISFTLIHLTFFPSPRPFVL